MLNEKPPFTTVVSMRVEVSHWATASPESIVDMLKVSLNYPAIQSIKVNSVLSNHTNHDGPLIYLYPCEFKENKSDDFIR